MTGLELSKKYYEEYGREMLEKMFPDVKDRIAVGLVGEGSECFGLDDENSQDHDFEPGFCLWITASDAKLFGFKLERAYAKLPNEFLGYKRTPMNPCGGNRHGVQIIEEFYAKLLGIDMAPTTAQDWMRLPDDTIATAINGEVYVDKLGEFSKIRQAIINCPNDVILKKLASKLVKMGLSGQYNYQRSVIRKDFTVAQLTLAEFVQNGILSIYLLNHKFAPYYKLAVRGIRELSILNDIEPSFRYLLEHDNSEKEYYKKVKIIEDIANRIILELKKMNITDATCNNLDTHAYSVMDHIKDPNLRNMHIMQG